MREARRSQPTLTEPWLDMPYAKELAAISRLLHDHPMLSQLVAQDVARGAESKRYFGLSGDQILRCLIVKQLNTFSYQELAFQIADSRSHRAFCGFGLTDADPARSTLAENIKRVTPETLEKINRLLVQAALELGVESGRKVRVDSTAVETNVHAPSDSSLLWDCVRVLSDLMSKARALGVPEIVFPDRRRVAKSRHRRIGTARKNTREKLYRELLKATDDVVGAARRVLDQVRAHKADEAEQVGKLADVTTKLDRFLGLTERVINQTRRRVIDGESVPASEKIVSIFEDHTDVIVKSRETEYGHKVFLTGGSTSMILDCIIARGNPADASLALPMIERLTDIYGQPPRQAAFDGGFASTQNLEVIKKAGVEDVMFCKSRGLKISDMVRSEWVYRKLRNFRAGIEGCISFLKRAIGLARCTWRSFESFKAYVWASVLSCNLLVIARCLLR